MGVGFSADLVVCVALGIDMFDCVFPTRTAVRNNISYSVLFHMQFQILCNSNRFSHLFQNRDLVLP